MTTSPSPDFIWMKSSFLTRTTERDTRQNFWCTSKKQSAIKALHAQKIFS